MEYRSRYGSKLLHALGVGAFLLQAGIASAGTRTAPDPHEKSDDLLSRAERLRTDAEIPPGKRPPVEEVSLRPVKNGKETHRAGYVGMLFRNDGPKDISLGTGSLLCPNVVLTVAHIANKFTSTSRMSFTLGKNAIEALKDPEANRKVVDSFALSAVPGIKDKLTPEEASLDIALMKVDPPFGKD
jgi:hypothetical protein